MKYILTFESYSGETNEGIGNLARKAIIGGAMATSLLGTPKAMGQEVKAPTEQTQTKTSTLNHLKMFKLATMAGEEPGKIYDLNTIGDDIKGKIGDAKFTKDNKSNVIFFSKNNGQEKLSIRKLSDGSYSVQYLIKPDKIDHQVTITNWEDGGTLNPGKQGYDIADKLYNIIK